MLHKLSESMNLRVTSMCSTNTAEAHTTGQTVFLVPGREQCKKQTTIMALVLLKIQGHPFHPTFSLFALRVRHSQKRSTLWQATHILFQKWKTGQRAHTANYKTNKFWEPNEQHGESSQSYCITYLKADKKVDLQCSHHQKKKKER